MFPLLLELCPVTNSSQIKRICQLSGTYLPERLGAMVEKFGDSPLAMKQAGIAYATEQIIDLIANGVKAIHLYTMNKPTLQKPLYPIYLRFWTSVQLLFWSKENELRNGY
ncbi:MAG: methylenetetrahydrofolate reductase [Acutalibacteraceae bacterium]